MDTETTTTTEKPAAPAGKAPARRRPATTAAQAAPAALVPPNRLYVFAKTCTNDHGHFAKGDKARGAFAPELVASYLAAGVLVPVDPATPAEPDTLA